MSIRTIAALIPPKVRGGIIVGLALGAGKFLKVSWSEGVSKAFSGGLKSSRSVGKLMANAKYAKALNILGLVDIIGASVVQSDVDKGYFGLIPGAGLVELGASIINQAFGTDFLNARWGLSI